MPRSWPVDFPIIQDFPAACNLGEARDHTFPLSHRIRDGSPIYMAHHLFRNKTPDDETKKCFHPISFRVVSVVQATNRLPRPRNSLGGSDLPLGRPLGVSIAAQGRELRACL